MSPDFIAKLVPPEVINEPVRWLVFCQQQILLAKRDDLFIVPEHLDFQSLGLPINGKQYLGTWKNQHWFCAEMEAPQQLPAQFLLQPLRQAALQFDEGLFGLASRALQLLLWDKSHQFCSQCATPLQMHHAERVKICTKCELAHYPRISPTIIVLIQRGKEILLARSPHFTPGVYSTLAGFIEPGESAEQAVAREVFEEVGLKIKNLQYHFSQSWPFPHSLMLGFTAEYAAGEIIIDGVEIEDAGWYTLDNLPPLPSPISIARKLIDIFIQRNTSNGKKT